MDDDECVFGFGMDGDGIVRNLFLILGTWDDDECVLDLGDGKLLDESSHIFFSSWNFLGAGCGVLIRHLYV